MNDLTIRAGVASMGNNNGGTSNGSPNSISTNFNATVKDIFILESQRKEFFSDFIDSNFPIGTIKFQRVYSALALNDEHSYATPRNIHNMMYPRVGEMITISVDESYNAQDNAGSAIRVYQYSQILSSWGAVEQNIVPKDSVFKIDKAKPSVEDYRTTQTGVVNSTQGGNSYGVVEIGTVKTLYPLNDNIIQGRGGNSIRLGTSDDSIKEIPWKGPFGKPVLIFRNGQKVLPKNAVDNIFEDINADGSSIYLLSGQTINVAVACLNFESYGLDVQEVVKSNIVEVKQPVPVSTEPNVQQDVPPKKEEPVVVLSVTSSVSPVSSSMQEEVNDLPANEDDLFVQDLQNPEVPITNGILIDAPTISSNVKKGTGVSPESTFNNGEIVGYGLPFIKFEKSSGKIMTDGIPSYVKAYLDIIAVMEYTSGRGKYNGYDVYFGKNNVIKNYSDDEKCPVHPNIKIKYKSNPDDWSTAAGRYQFIYGTWVKVNGSNAKMTKVNQDNAAYKRMLWNVNNTDLFNSTTDYNTFKKVIGGSSTFLDNKCLAGIWASLPASYTSSNGEYGPKGIYNQNKSNQKSFSQLWTMFQSALKIYQ